VNLVYLHARLICSGVCLAACAWTASQWRSPTVHGKGRMLQPPVTRQAGAPTFDSTLSLLELLLERMPFDATAPNEDNDESPTMQLDSAAPLHRDPSLILSGIVLGAVPQIILSRLDGVEGSRALRIGDTIADVRLLEVHEAFAIVAVGGKRVTAVIGRPIVVPP
jgi:hypothetical protein